MSFQNLAIFIILLSGCLAISAAGARGSNNQTVDERSSQLTLSRVEINEEMDAGLLIVNLTALIRNETNHSAAVDSIKFDKPQRSGQFHLSDYFQIETKRVRSQHNKTASSTTNIVLRTSGKKLDREYLCRLSSLKSECSCEYDCIVWLDLIVDDRQSARLPILVRDINDNKPYFYSDEIKIELDLSSSTESSVRIPLKEAFDLDSMASHRVKEYRVREEDDELDGMREGKVRVIYDKQQKKASDGSDKPKLNLLVDWTPTSNTIENQSLK